MSIETDFEKFWIIFSKVLPAYLNIVMKNFILHPIYFQLIEINLTHIQI